MHAVPNNDANPLPAVDAYWLLRQWRRRVIADVHPARALLVLQLERAISAIGRQIHKRAAVCEMAA